MTDRVFVGHLPQSMGQQQFQDMMGEFGAIVKADLKLGYGFVTYAEASSAEAAISALNGKDVDGNRIACEPSRSSGPYPSGMGVKPERRDQYRIVVEGINDSVTWAELKDFSRDQGIVATYADVRKIDGVSIGTIAFPTIEDMNRAISDLNGKELKGCSISVRESTEPLPPAPRPRYDNRDGGFRGGDRFDDRRRDDGPRGGDRYDDRRRDDGPRGGGGYDRYDDRGFDRRRDDGPGPRGGDRFDDRRRDDGPRGGYDRYDDRGFDRRDDRYARDERGGYDRRDDRGFDRRDDRGGAFYDRRDDRGFDRRDEPRGGGGGGGGYGDRGYPPRRESPPRGGGYRDGPRGGDFGGYNGGGDRRGDYPPANAGAARGGPAGGPRGGNFGGPGDRNSGYQDRR